MASDKPKPKPPAKWAGDPAPDRKPKTVRRPHRRPASIRRHTDIIEGDKT